MDTEQPWRVYLAEWLVAYTSDAPGADGQAECRQHFRAKYRGRVRDEDWRVIPAVLGMEPQRAPYCLQMYLPNLQGEFKDEADARRHSRRGQHGESPQIVQRGSDGEQELLDYGRKMLPVAGVNGGNER